MFENGLKSLIFSRRNISSFQSTNSKSSLQSRLLHRVDYYRSLHWYLVIIYQPEHVLMPSPPTIPSPSVSTRTRKNHSDLTGQLVQPPTLDHSTQPQDRAREMSVSRLPSPSPMGNEGEVEEMFNRSCSISADQSQHTSTASSSAADQKDHEAPEVDSIVLDDDGELHELQYPSPGTTTSQMDVDELAGDGLINDNMSHEVLMTSSKPLSAGVISSGLVSEKPNSVSSKSSAVGPASFYSSAPKKGKEKAKAGRQPQPFPLDVVDVSCSDYGEQDEVDELLNEPDASTPPGRPTWVSILSMFILGLIQSHILGLIFLLWILWDQNILKPSDF